MLSLGRCFDLGGRPAGRGGYKARGLGAAPVASVEWGHWGENLGSPAVGSGAKPRRAAVTLPSVARPVAGLVLGALSRQSC